MWKFNRKLYFNDGLNEDLCFLLTGRHTTINYYLYITLS